MNKKELIRSISEKCNISLTKARQLLNIILGQTEEAISKNGTLRLKNLGTFKVTKRSKRTYYNLATKGQDETKEKMVVKFSPSKRLKKKINCHKTVNPKDPKPETTNIPTNPQSITLAIDRPERPKGRSKNDDVPIRTNIPINPRPKSPKIDRPEPPKGRTEIGGSGNRKNTKGNNKDKKRKSKESNTQDQLKVDNGGLVLGNRANCDGKDENFTFTYSGTFDFECYQGEADHKSFPSFKAPRLGTKVLNYLKDNIGATTGVTEPILREVIADLCLKSDGLKIVDHVKLPIANRNYSYRPDICLQWEKYNLLVDIEIDEPYDIVSREPIHYIGSRDNLRDKYFIRNGWCVVRFCEEQIATDINGVVEYLRRLLKWITGDASIGITADGVVNDINRWSYDEAKKCAESNYRESYLKIDPQTIIEISGTETKLETKPDDDILPNRGKGEEWQRIADMIKDLQKSDVKNCIVTKKNGYKWIYDTKSLHIVFESDGNHIIIGDSILGFELPTLIEEIKDIELFPEVFSKVSYHSSSTFPSLSEFKKLEQILADVIISGKPLWVLYKSRESGLRSRYLSNVTFDRTAYSLAPHIGLGLFRKYGKDSWIIQQIRAYCSIRQEFRTFATDDRIVELKVLNCDKVYLVNDTYANSLTELVMNPYSNHYGNCFFENADAILDIMPEKEKQAFYTQGNIANLAVMKGELDNALKIYTNKQFDSLVSYKRTWGEACLEDIKYFIDLCSSKINAAHYYEVINPNKLLANFQTILKMLREYGWPC